MSVKNDVLHMLEQNKGKSISGQELAENLGVSRTAVWKAINLLKEDGFLIEGISNKGYSLAISSDLLSSEGIRLYLKDEYKELPVKVYKSINSTNTEAKLMIMNNAVHGTVILAEEQLSGKGRMGRGFYSPPESGIYMSIILKPKLNMNDSVLITTAAAVAVSLAIEKTTGIVTQIKWVNDIYLNDKKICGILTEAVTDMESGTIESVVVGIGLNIKTESFPVDIENTAGSIFKIGETKFIRNQLSAEIINNVLSVLNDISSRKFIEIYKERSMILGERIRYFRDNQWFEGYAQDIDSNGALIVFHDNGHKEILNSGEITVRRSL
ncbi:biotin--[acetyl-CoA-carboxylase] ligase [Sedimentibacter hydroxybenzoicus DSM 7310]|uniref:Bifunctional ligase/repressor BirA n=1 Tax=Sedimentibacter hydroxybenzoicus DSM 7310 TaxID=1123245 RepID=A0A974BHJ3_SEDHY|nr:biotin--[acetyl-CoA-carboxylase] ligase [Sedimentibacter hydroxybenzoicus DSM 7310]